MPALKDAVMPILLEHAFSTVAVYSIVLAVVCVAGDYVCSALAQHPVSLRAVADSATHGVVGVMSWAVVLTPGSSWVMWWQCMLCGMLACIIDVDHFVQAGSLHLKDALSLQQRPPMHSTSTIIFITSTMWVISLLLKWPQLKKVAMVCFVAWMTHHFRDAYRRGLWLPPLGSTPPLPYGLYITFIVALAVASHFLFHTYFIFQAAGDSDSAQLSRIISA